MSSAESSSAESRNDLPGLPRLAAGTVLGLFAGVIWSTVAGTTYEATAFIEADGHSDLPTIEEKLRFPSLYRQVSESDDAARDLARRTRAKIRRGSRLVAVTVAHSEPETAADESNRIAEAFLTTWSLPTKPPAAAKSAPISPPDPAAADSPESLAEAWSVQTAEFEKLSRRYANDAAHPAVAGARQRLDALGKRITERATALRGQFGLPDPAPEENSANPGAQLQSLQTAISALATAAPEPAADPQPKARAFPSSVVCVLAEPASVPTEPVGPAKLAIWLGGAALGAFAALFWSWCCPCGRSRA